MTDGWYRWRGDRKRMRPERNRLRGQLAQTGSRKGGGGGLNQTPQPLPRSQPPFCANRTRDWPRGPHGLYSTVIRKKQEKLLLPVSCLLCSESGGFTEQPADPLLEQSARNNCVNSSRTRKLLCEKRRWSCGALQGA